MEEQEQDEQSRGVGGVCRHSRGSFSPSDGEPSFQEFIAWLLQEKVRLASLT